jgi:two-component system, chemotaxis family, protein-glutamate methylesterase/glutaminase
MAVVGQKLAGTGQSVEPVGGPVVVALVCSAGGLEALTTLLEGLPPDLPAAVIALQHRAPDERDRLPAILARRCLLEVTAAKDGSLLRPGTVFVVQPGHHAVVAADNRLVLVPTDGPPPYRPSADLLLTSLALVAGHRTIAVVLSGLGHDGATGAMALHRFGGAVIASDRASSAHF